MRIIYPVVLFLVFGNLAALAQLSPEEAVSGHFDEIVAEQYTAADQYFSTAFRSAFKGEVETLNHYYLVRREQIRRGYSVIETRTLDDEGHLTAMVVIDFDPPPTAPIAITERLYYYLILEQQSASGPGTDPDGYAWRIDIFDSFLFESLAEARRRPYLYTRESWPDQASKELKSRQGLFRIQWALESYYYDKLQYPERLYGGTHNRDPLVVGGYLTGSYPGSGFNDRPMEEVDAMQKSSGDFTYISFDSIDDGELDSYWLLLHGKVRNNYYYDESDIIYILGNTTAKGQHAIAEAFAHFWFHHSDGRELQLTSATQPIKPRAGLVDAPTQSSVPDPDQAGLLERQISGVSVFRNAASAADWRETTENAGLTPEIAAVADAVWGYVTTKAPGMLAKAPLPPPPPPAEPEPLVVYSFGF